ncbi:hypothetical protein A2810_03135 [candidate division Kazan bacterium RIFCSPHIGHO2_01_FULL_49_10]|uniref:EamA domain-containing protein n=1 Tax=candidate division Kazan bacterium RIFCSPLOWO2_01_FULL_45_19 TaxID=1798538 RepID=A0A1F4NP85_UNCK3|nr:MAG: hypothetical protein A3K51_00045 [candidate division Kazan bacterium RIFCSPLOWO2_01_FULL_45_19]OGB74929.1 MAG: hypothetical protein A2810_03135 [candidate division Kazan bacterium RIFCSPHIGHO2_01_FULL_49_10]OGB77504.1 MAG: hypothetical protein A3K24_00045 [candidate division Kazan bacterium RIFCSPHIGHO2_01_FULL_44_14]
MTRINGRISFVLQALFVVFLWSAAKIIIKMGVQEIPPFMFAALVQTMAVVGLLIYYKFHKRKYRLKFNRQDVQLMILLGLVTFGGSTLFSIIGLQYVTGATAGMIAALNPLMAVGLSVVILRERPGGWQYLGLIGMLVGAYIFLARGEVTGALIGIALLLLAEAGFAFSNVVTRLISRQPGDESLTITLVGNLIGAVTLIPIGLTVDGLSSIAFTPHLVSIIVTVGLIFGFGGLLWAGVLDKLKVVEATVLSNTMIVQMAILSVLFLGEALTANNITGGLLVLIGALVIDKGLILPPRFTMKMV